jgi:hypothetical protein
VKYERTERFKRDYRKLTEGEREQFRRAVLEEFHQALERRLADPGSAWPKRLRIKDVEGAPGVWEMTWSFSDPDGRATWEWIKIEDEPGIRWRRIGSHAIFRDP